MLLSEIIVGYSEIMQNIQPKYISGGKCSSTKVKGNTDVHQSRAAGPVAIKFCTLLPNTCGSKVWNLFHVTILTLKILRDS